MTHEKSVKHAIFQEFLGNSLKISHDYIEGLNFSIKKWM